MYVFSMFQCFSVRQTAVLKETGVFTVFTAFSGTAYFHFCAIHVEHIGIIQLDAYAVHTTQFVYSIFRAHHTAHFQFGSENPSHWKKWKISSERSIGRNTVGKVHVYIIFAFHMGNTLGLPIQN